MLLANGINLPLVAVLGLVVFIPLTLFVVVVECLVLRWYLRVPLKKSFRIVLIANVVSTLAGWLVYGFHDEILYAWGLRRLYDYAHFYVYAALPLIAIYYAKSTLVEGLIIARRRVTGPLGLSRKRLWAGVLLGNALSYLFVGPLFYFTTRPTFEGVNIVLHPASVAACKDTVFYLDKNKHLCTVNADGTGQRTITTRPVSSFHLSADRRLIACVGPDDSIWVQSIKSADPTVIQGTAECGLKFSADAKRVILCTESELTQSREAMASDQVFRWTLAVFDLDRKAVIATTAIEGQSSWAPEIGWDADDNTLLWYSCDDNLRTLRLTAEGLMDAPATSRPSALVTNLHSEDIARSWSNQGDTQGDLTMYIWPHIGATMRISRGDKVIWRFRDNRGILGLGQGGPRNGEFLSRQGKVVFQADRHVYVGDITSNTIAPLVEGCYLRIVADDHVGLDGHIKGKVDSPHPVPK